MQTVKYKNYTVRRLESGTIEATKHGRIVSPTKPILRDIAKELDVKLENTSGVLHNTRQLGTLIIKAIKEKQSSQNMQSEYQAYIANPLDNQPNPGMAHISFMNAIKKIINDSPLTPQKIREEIKKNYPYLYGTESHHKNVDKGHYQDISHAVLAQIYSQTKDNKDFLIDKSTKPLTIGLSKHIKLSISKIEELIEEYLHRNKYGTFYLAKGERIEKVLVENIVPNAYGVYIIYSVKDTQEEIIYIGKAGTITTNGEFKNQGIKDRLKAVTTNDMPRGKYFQQDVIEKYGLDKLKFIWIVTFDDTRTELPAYSESRLIQLYYDEHHMLPMLNRSI